MPNASARLVLDLRLRDDVSQALRKFHWLPIDSRIEHKLCLLVHKTSIGHAPKYRTLPTCWHLSQRSATNGDSIMPRTHRKLGERAFSVAAPRAWNRLPSADRTENVNLFHWQFQTFPRIIFISVWNTWNTCWLTFEIRRRSDCRGGAIEIIVVFVFLFVYNRGDQQFGYFRLAAPLLDLAVVAEISTEFSGAILGLLLGFVSPIDTLEGVIAMPCGLHARLCHTFLVRSKTYRPCCNFYTGG